MKNIKKIASILLSLIFVLSMSTVAFAAAGAGEIVITNAKLGQTYHLYKIFDLAPGYIEDNPNTAENESKYSYTVDNDWASFINQSTIKGSYVNVDASGYVTWVKDADVAAFAKLAIAWAKANNPTADKTFVGNTADDYKATGLALGYYLIDTTTGTICSLTTTDHSQTVVEKNDDHTGQKQVKEDSISGDAAWGKKSTSDIGQINQFKATLTVKPGAEKLVYHDIMDAGLTPVDGSDADTLIDIAITLNDVNVESSKYDLTMGTDHDGNGPNPAHTFCVAFHQDFLDSITGTSTIVITYSATVNSNAVRKVAISNKEYLTWGENGNIESLSDTTETYSFGFNILKTDEKTNSSLENAHFVLYKTVGQVNHYAIVANDKLTAWTTVKDDATTLITKSDGKITVDGLDADTYYIEETKAPNGYNKLNAPVNFVIDENGNVIYENRALNDDTIKIANTSGGLLPSTGGIGTMLFYVFGSVLVLVAVALLVAKKRKNATK